MMEPLSEDELACLKLVGRGKVRTDDDCRPGVLLSLQRLGLVLKRPVRLLPIENMSHDYVPSTAGRRLLGRLLSGR